MKDLFLDEAGADEPEGEKEMKQARMNQKALNFLLHHRRVFCLRKAICSQ